MDASGYQDASEGIAPEEVTRKNGMEPNERTKGHLVGGVRGALKIGPALRRRCAAVQLLAMQTGRCARDALVYALDSVKTRILWQT